MLVEYAGRALHSAGRQGAEPEYEHAAVAGLGEQHVRSAQGPRLEVREEGFREHELLAGDAAGGNREWFACDVLCDGGQGDVGDDLRVIESEHLGGEAQVPG